jgi:hypothetical protein
MDTMNSDLLEDLLKVAGKRGLDVSWGAGGLKRVLMLTDCDLHGHQFLKDTVYSLTESEAQVLWNKGQGDVLEGGLTDIGQTKRPGKEAVLAYRPWPSTYPNNFKDSATRFDNVFLLVRLLKNRQIVLRVRIEIGEQFYLPYSYLRTLSDWDIEGEWNPSQQPMLEILADQA